MEDRVRACSTENEELHKRIEQLESQNKTLSGQLKRLHQILVGGGGLARHANAAQTSTAMMVILLSTALFLIPGFKEHTGEGKMFNVCVQCVGKIINCISVQSIYLNCHMSCFFHKKRMLD